MGELFRNILNASVQGSLVIAVVLILRPLLWKAPKKYICLLWVLVGLRLLNPFSIESKLSLQPQTEAFTAGLCQALVQGGDFLPLLWMVCAAGMLFYSMISYAMLKFRLREAIRVVPRSGSRTGSIRHSFWDTYCHVSTCPWTLTAFTGSWCCSTNGAT